MVKHFFFFNKFLICGIYNFKVISKFQMSRMGIVNKMHKIIFETYWGGDKKNLNIMKFFFFNMHYNSQFINKQ